MGQRHPAVPTARLCVGCTLEAQDGGTVGALCRVDVAGGPPAQRGDLLVASAEEALRQTSERIGLVRPRPPPDRLGRAVLLLVGGAPEHVDALLRRMPFLRRGARTAGRDTAAAWDVVSADLHAVPGFGADWGPSVGPEGARCSVRGPLHLALLRRPPGAATDRAPEFALLLGEAHAAADGCPEGPEVVGGEPVPCLSGLDLLRAAVRRERDLFLESDPGLLLPGAGAPALAAVAERRFLPCLRRHGADPGDLCPAGLRVHPVDGRFREPAWVALLALAEASAADFDRVWLEVGGERGLVAAVAGLGTPNEVRRARATLDAALHQHPRIPDEDDAEPSRLQLAVDRLREQGRLGILCGALDAAGPLPVAAWRQYLLAFVVELEALAVWLDRRVALTSGGLVLVAGAFHTRRARALLGDGLGMEVVFEVEAREHRCWLSGPELDALAAACGCDRATLVGPPAPALPTTPPGRPPVAATGVVATGCARGFWCVRTADPERRPVGLVLQPGPPDSVSAMLDPFFLHMRPPDIARLAADGLPVIGHDCTAGARFGWAAGPALRQWRRRGWVDRVAPNGDGSAEGVAAAVVAAHRRGRFALVLADLDGRARPADVARALARLSGGQVTAPWSHPIPAAGAARALVRRPPPPGSRPPVAAGVLLPVPPGADLDAARTYPAYVGNGLEVPWGVDYPTPDIA